MVFVPNKNTPIPDHNGPILVWDATTGLCIAYCAAIHEWRQQMYENDGDYTWWHVFRCADDCMPEDYEKDLIAKVVEHQQVCNPDGTPVDELVRAAGGAGRPPRQYRVSRRTVRSALQSAWPEPRKPLPPRPSKLDEFKPIMTLTPHPAQPRGPTHP
ncbi:hypothetical protein ACFPIJ_00270 [Dactylosporangium cerinum]|uniref:Uncharacterized protein n=1 Tax=Dactylosporangium cerinum TaxID=1434730 RepID=A0ABV9VIY5_9ACTN